MCAGAYLDRNFRDQVLRGVYNDRNRRVAPSYGFDAVVVVRQAWRAWWLEFCQYLAVLAVFGCALAGALPQAVIAVAVLTLWHLLRRVLGGARGLLAYYTGRATEFDTRRMRAQGRLVRAGLTVASVALVLAMAAAFTASGGQAASGGWAGRAGLTGAGIILAVLALIVAATASLRVAWSGQLRPVDRKTGRVSGRRMRAIGHQQHHPVIVHSGFKPFIGSGTPVRGWSFAQRLIHQKGLGMEPDKEFDQLPFTAEGLIEHLKTMITGLCTHDHPETRLPGLEVSEHLFVEGTHAERFRHILRSERDSAAITAAMKAAVANPSDVARHYLACRVESWGGEVVTSVFVHVSLQGRTLYLEFSTYALLPTRYEYHIIDEPGGTGAGALGRALAQGFSGLPGELVAAWRVVRAPAQLWAALRPCKDRTASAGARMDIGAAISAREIAAAPADESYFQYQDILQHSKIIERRLIATVGDRLKELGVDTSEFWERARAILNTGVINAGPGTVNLTDSAVGDQATVTTEASPAEG